jgi:hypothetical protein
MRRGGRYFPPPPSARRLCSAHKVLQSLRGQIPWRNRLGAYQLLIGAVGVGA